MTYLTLAVFLCRECLQELPLPLAQECACGSLLCGQPTCQEAHQESHESSHELD